jgi:hypothetical protein
MTPSPSKILTILLALSMYASAAPNDRGTGPGLRLLLSELQPGSLASEHYCMLVFDDHSFHSERAHRTRGRDQERKVYEGQLSDVDWNTLTAILDTKKFRELRVPPGTPSLVVHDTHPYTISVARQSGFQNMEFLSKASIKPYESEIKPLLQWWKNIRSAPMHESEAPPDSRCSLTEGNAVFSN